MNNPRLLLALLVFFVSFVQVRAQNAARPSFVDAGTGERVELGAVSPNELPNLRLFAGGRLGGLRLSVSTRKDVEIYFGEPRRREGRIDVYDYDENWEATFSYFEAADRHPWKRLPHLTVPEYVGRLMSVSLVAKRAVAFDRATLPSGLKCFGPTWKTTDQYACLDAYGLSYEIRDDGRGERDAPRFGSVLKIGYAIPARFNEELYAVPASYYETYRFF